MVSDLEKETSTLLHANPTRRTDITQALHIRWLLLQSSETEILPGSVMGPQGVDNGAKDSLTMTTRRSLFAKAPSTELRIPHRSLPKAPFPSTWGRPLQSDLATRQEMDPNVAQKNPEPETLNH